MPKSVKLVDDQGRELKGIIRKAGTEVHPRLVITFDTEAEAKEFAYTVRDDPIKLCKAIVDLFSQKELLASYEPRHKPKVATQPPIEADSRQSTPDSQHQENPD